MIVEIPSNVPIWPVILLVLITVLAILWRKRPSPSYILCLCIFSIYLFVALDQTLLPIQISGPDADYMREQPFTSRINLIPFPLGQLDLRETSFSTLILNIILTIPFGFGVNFIAPVRAKTFIWLAPAVGFVIEMIQLIISLALRYPYRFIDINDVIMNGFGTLIGYGMFRVFAWLYVLTTQRLDIDHQGLAAYIYNIAIRATTTNKSLETINSL